MGEQKNIKFKYIFSDDYNPKYCNGAYGGITSKGEITVNFYFERQALPNQQMHQVLKDGRLNENPEFKPEDFKNSIVRYIDTGIIMNLQTAKEIVIWLKGKIDILEKSKKSGHSSTKRIEKS